MINQDKWISSIPNINTKFNKATNQLDHDKWINTIPQKKVNNTIKKYPLIAVLFVCGLVFVSAVKNETRNLQKDINDLETSIDQINSNLQQAILDNEVITAPENISQLAKEYLNIDLKFYKQSQIKQLNTKAEKFIKVSKIKKEKNIQKNLKQKVINKINKTKTELAKLQELSSNPKSIPYEIKTKITKKIKEKENELKNLYDSPKDLITLERVQRWGAVQIVKVFLGIPVIPGR